MGKLVFVFLTPPRVVPCPHQSAEVSCLPPTTLKEQSPQEAVVLPSRNFVTDAPCFLYLYITPPIEVSQRYVIQPVDNYFYIIACFYYYERVYLYIMSSYNKSLNTPSVFNAIKNMRNKGMTLAAIGEHFNVSRERVRQIIAIHNDGKPIERRKYNKSIICRECKSMFTIEYGKQTRIYCTPECLKRHMRVHSFLGIDESISTLSPERRRQYNAYRLRQNYKENPESIKRAILNYAKKDIGRKKTKARALVMYHVKNGNLHKPDRCQDCNEPGLIHGHHHDYNKPLDVIWLCPRCHSKKHRK